MALAATQFEMNSNQKKSAPTENFQKCAQQSLRQLTATSRDLALMNCLKQHREISQAKCLQVSTRFEYQTNADQARSFCLFEKTSLLNAEFCAKEVSHYIFDENEDSARWRCLMERTVSMSQRTCLKIAQGINSIPAREKAIQYCEMRR